jgi:hypothetical protein
VSTSENNKGSIFKVWLQLRRSLYGPLTSAIVVRNSTEGDDELKDGHVGLLLPNICPSASEPLSYLPSLLILVEASLPGLLCARVFGRNFYLQMEAESRNGHRSSSLWRPPENPTIRAPRGVHSVRWQRRCFYNPELASILTFCVS